VDAFLGQWLAVQGALDYFLCINSVLCPGELFSRLRVYSVMLHWLSPGGVLSD